MAAILAVRHSDILGAPNAAELIDQYASECAVDIHPQVEQYAEMERLGALQCFGVYDHGPTLVGFASILSAVMPHNGLRVGTVESIFIADGYRRGLSIKLLDFLEDYAEHAGCVTLLYGPRVGSALEKILSRRPKCTHTHAIYSRWFQ
jgi:hypothetical protein